MAPKTQFTKDDIVEVAFKIAQAEGTSKITVRRVADDLGCSVAPIYVNFKNSQELLDAVVLKSMDIANELRMRPYTDIAFLNMGVGTLKFAMDYPVLMKEFALLENGQCMPSAEEYIHICAAMRTFDVLIDVSDVDLRNIYWKMQIFTMGLVILIITNSLPMGMGWDQLVELLRETGYDIINSTIANIKEKK